MRKYIYPLLTVLVIVGLYYAEQYASKKTEAYPDTSNETVKSTSVEFAGDLLPTSTSGVVVNHTFYTLSYVEKHEQSEYLLQTNDLLIFDQKTKED